MIYARLRLGQMSSYSLGCLMNKRSSQDTEVKQQHTRWLSSKLDATTDVADPFIPPFESAIRWHL
jgi:hypothetical protein